VKRKSITVKLFVITTLFFVIFTTITLFLQSAFIGGFYYKWKSKAFDTNFKTFSSSFIKSNKSINENSSLIQQFETKNNARVALQTTYSNGNMRIMSVPKPDISANLPGKPFQMLLDNRLQELTTGFNQLIEDSLNYSKLMNKGQTVITKYEDSINKTDCLIGAAPIVVNGETTSILMASTSLQPIDEVPIVLKNYYLFFYVIALVLILIMSLIYTNMISKPLILLNKAALKMSELDFSSKCIVNTQDEIGNLAATFNFLSEKLDGTLNELQAANEKLTEDIEKEKKLEKMRREFVAGVSHELKTPISLIAGYAEAIKDNISSGTKRDYYSDVIMDETGKMAGLVSDMLDLSQLEAGSFKLDIEEFCLNELLEIIIKKYSSLLLQQKKEFELCISSNNIIVIGDSLRIEQVITNLFNNAIEHTEENNVIKLKVSDTPDKITLEIENPGKHIPKEELQNIWEKFYRIEKSRSKSHGGSGIGLSIVKDILELHGSIYGVANTEYGVSFYFTLNKYKNKL
jgi:two-component system, OmpR family, sensor histidine kinase VanS